MDKKLLSAAMVLLCCLCSCASYAQWQNGLWTEKQANNWFYGVNEGLNFDTSPPTPISGQVQPAAMGLMVGGTGAMSDSDGNLLFYSDGITVWDSTHSIMQNGSGLFGNLNSMQSGLIVPRPGTPGHYFVFSVDSPMVGEHGISYSEIDMSLNNGLGAVTASKNIPLVGLAASKITATYHSDGSNIWVLCHLLDGNEFAAFLVSAQGVPTTPVISAVGQAYAIALQEETGQLKFSPDGSKVAFANPYVTRKLQVFNFDNGTGILSDPILTVDAEFTGGIVLGPFGVEFSPNSKLLYVTEGDDYLGFGFSRLHQFNLAAGDEAAVKNSDTVIKEYSWDGTGNYNEWMIMGGLQLTPEGKIYLRPFYNNNNGYVNAINYPNNLGQAAGYEEGTVGLAEGLPENAISGGWYPGFIQSYFASGILYTDLDCNNTSLFSLLRIPGITAVSWDFGDTGSGSANTSDLLDPSHTFSGAGSYTVTATITSNGSQQTTSTQISVGQRLQIGTPETLAECEQQDGIASFNLLSQEAALYGGQDASILTLTYHTSAEDAQSGSSALDNASDLQSSGQTIYARLTNPATGCFAVAAFDITVLPKPVLGEDFKIEGCGTYDLTLFGQTAGDGLEVTYYREQEDALAGNNAIADPEHFISEEETATLYARAVTADACFAVVPVQLLRADCFIQKGISPNGDGSNDSFDLEYYASQYGISSLSIFNRYGRNVYARDNYSNEWKGQDGNGNELPTGTYYYVIRFRNSHPEFGQQASSWIYIQREN